MRQNMERVMEHRRLGEQWIWRVGTASLCAPHQPELQLCNATESLLGARQQMRLAMQVMPAGQGDPGLQPRFGMGASPSGHKPSELPLSEQQRPLWQLYPAGQPELDEQKAGVESGSGMMGLTGQMAMGPPEFKA